MATLLIAGQKPGATHLFRPIPAGPAEEPYTALCGVSLAPKIQVHPFYQMQVLQDVTCDVCSGKYLQTHNPAEPILQRKPFFRNAPKDFTPVQGSLF